MLIHRRIASEESWRKVMEINVIGVANMIQAVAKPMAANGGGKIVVVSSTAGHGYDSFAGVPYTASKWAVHGMLFTARMQLNAHGIVVSEYAPGEADTPLVKKRPVQPSAKHKEAMITCADCADAMFFIASQPHSMSIVQLPAYQPFGGMPPLNGSVQHAVADFQFVAPRWSQIGDVEGDRLLVLAQLHAADGQLVLVVVLRAVVLRALE
jgi:NAD(P)-dependent dehydrogenase (short-subunit alcohol dehydrogenase family)